MLSMWAFFVVGADKSCFYRLQVLYLPFRGEACDAASPAGICFLNESARIKISMRNEKV